MLKLMKQKLLAVSFFERISNFVRYHQTGVNQGRNLMPRLSSNFKKTWIH